MARGIILAAGRGSRMGAATEAQPKCLTRFRDRTLLDWQLTALSGADVSPVALVTGYRAEALAPFADARFHNAHWSETQMVRSLETASEWLRTDPCIVSYSDIAYEAESVRALLACGADIAISYFTRWRELWEQRFADPLSDAETFRRSTDGQLLEIGGRAKSLDEIEGQYMGLLKFTPTGWKAVQADLAALPSDRVDHLDMTSLLARLIERGVEIQTVPVSGLWVEIDSPSDLG